VVSSAPSPVTRDNSTTIALANLLVQLGRADEAEAVLRPAASGGDRAAVRQLADLLVQLPRPGPPGRAGGQEQHRQHNDVVHVRTREYPHRRRDRPQLLTHDRSAYEPTSTTRIRHLWVAGRRGSAPPSSPARLTSHPYGDGMRRRSPVRLKSPASPPPPKASEIGSCWFRHPPLRHIQLLTENDHVPRGYVGPPM
jgi:hypothetical protein